MSRKYSIRNYMVFGLVMKHERLAKACLERILNKKIARLEYIEVEKDENVSISAHGVRYDVYCENEDAIYNIEMQAYVVDALGKRSRYYQDMMDMNLLRKNESYSKLRHNIVIFICTYDPFKMGYHMYTFENRCRQEPSLLLDDATSKIILNTKGTRDDVPKPLQMFLHYIETGEALDEYTAEVDQTVDLVQNDDRWREPIMTAEEYMKERIECEVRERVKEEVQAQVQALVQAQVQAQLKDSIFRMLDNEEPSEKICMYINITENEFREYQAEYLKSRQ